MTERNIHIEEASHKPVEAQYTEIVERKGIGHPDSISDGVAEHVARRLSQEYLDRFGRVLHFNTDETQLAAGESAPEYGGGEMQSPIHLLIVGRATKRFEGERIPTESIALDAAREYLAENIPRLDFGTDIVVDTKLGEGSGDLTGFFREDGPDVPVAMDTSFGVGHAPLTETEQLVLNTERRLNEDYAAENPAIGPDIKIMGNREGDRIVLTVAAAIIDEYVGSFEAYKEAVVGVREYVEGIAAEYTDREVAVTVNAADEYDSESVYLTVTGTSAEHGDDGSVGRGNRVNGLITPNRSMSIEASSGKNPVNHVGKIYNLLSTEIAQAVVAEVKGIEDLRIRLLSQINTPIDDPQVADAHVVPEDGLTVDEVEADVTSIIDDQLANVTDVTERVINGDLTTF